MLRRLLARNVSGNDDTLVTLQSSETTIQYTKFVVEQLIFMMAYKYFVHAEFELTDVRR